MTEYESSFATQAQNAPQSQNEVNNEIAIEVQPISEIQISQSPSDDHKLFNSCHQGNNPKSNTMIHIENARLTKSQDISNRKPW